MGSTAMNQRVVPAKVGLDQGEIDERPFFSLPPCSRPETGSEVLLGRTEDDWC
jgi:hypothetical protein